MGFNESAFSQLPGMIKARIGRKDMSKEGEDEVVASLLDDLLAMSPTIPPQQPQASGSGARNEDASIPGAWN